MIVLAKLLKGDTVLDVACGPGIVACELAKFVSHITGIDITPSMIEQAKQMQKERKLDNMSWRIGDILTLPFTDSSFSLLITLYSFHHLLERQKVLVEMIRVCKPDKRIVIIDVRQSVIKYMNIKLKNYGIHHM